MKSLLVTSLVAVAACGPGDRNGDSNPDAPRADAPISMIVDAPPGTDESRVYAHSGSTLYRMDASTFLVVPIGPMTGIGTQSLTDLAIDKDDHMVGITLDKLYSIDPATGAATLIKDLSQSANGFTSLSYVPDPANAAADILVSANDQGAVFKIDPNTGDATQIGSFGTNASGKKIVSSGDLIGVR